MIISEIYQQYPVHQGLQDHMIRVAAVAKFVCDHTSFTVNERSVVGASLLHDMGNLIKVKFDLHSELFDPEGVDYWKEKQVALCSRFGQNVHEATMAMVHEITPSPTVIATINAAAFEHIEEIATHGTPETKVLEYADMRVGLMGVTSLAGRFTDIHARYVPHRFQRARVEKMQRAAEEIERNIFDNSNLTPSDITDESTAAIQIELWNWDIH